MVDNPELVNITYPAADYPAFLLGAALQGKAFHAQVLRPTLATAAPPSMYPSECER